MNEFQIFSMVAVLITLVLGTTTNAFLVIVICVTWARSKCLSSCDLLLLTHGVANIALQCTTSLELLVAFMWAEVYKLESIQKLFFAMFPACTFFSLLNTAWLCLFYCAKIANFSNVFFLHLKLRVTRMMPWLVLGSLLSSVAIGVPAIWDVRKASDDNSSAAVNGKGTWTYQYSSYYKILVEGVIFSLPLLVVVPSAVLILTSLYRHTQRMRQAVSGFSRGPSAEAHLGAAKTILALLLLYLCFHAAVLLMLSDVVKCKPAWLWVCNSVVCSYSFVHSVILILRNPKLKTAAAKMLRCGRH